MRFRFSFWVVSLVLFLLTNNAPAVLSSPSWSTYHGQEIIKTKISNNGITLGLTRRGAVFLLARDSSFIASWSRDEEFRLGSLILSQNGEYAAVCYDDGYTALFTHDGQEGTNLWAYRITQAFPATLTLSPFGNYVGVATNPTYFQGEREYFRPSTLYLFSTQGQDLWRRTLDTKVSSIAIREDRWILVGGASYETPSGMRGRDALYLYDEKGDLVWDMNLKEGVAKVGFTEEGILLLTTGDNFYFFDLEGNLIWERHEEVEVAYFTSTGYISGYYKNKVFLFTPEGERAWVHGIDEVKGLSLSREGLVAVMTSKDVTLWNEEGIEIFYYRPGEEMYSLALSDNGTYLILGLNKVSLFVFP